MIRKLTADDARDYQQLRLYALQTDPDAYFATYENLSTYSLSYFQSELSPSRESIYGYYGIFSDENKLIGYCCLQREYYAKQQHTAELMNLYIHPEFRKQSHARTLLTYVQNIVNEQSELETIFLTVIRDNTQAIKLYTALGFREYADKKHSLKVDGRYFDEVFMRFDYKKANTPTVRS